MLNLFTQARTVTLSGAAIPTLPTGESALLLRSISGTETLSEIYSYVLDCVTPLASMMPQAQASNLDLNDMIGNELTVTVQLDGMGSLVPGLPGPSLANMGAGKREISGIVTEAHFVEQLNRQSRYRLVMRPWIALTEKRSNFKIFQRKSVIDIVDEVLKDYLYVHEWRVSEIYPKLDYQVQYGETDFQFIQRLLAEHGIYWFFEHKDTFHRMIFVDGLGAHLPVDSEAYHTLWYYPPDHKIDEEYISQFDMRGSLQTGRWSTRDFDFKKPDVKLKADNELPMETLHNDIERYEWPGDYTNAENGKQIARVRMEELRAQGERATGSGNVRDVVCGTTFTLAGYPYAAANQEYLVISASFTATEAGEASGGGTYRMSTSFVVQPATTVFRPSRSDYPKPRTSGPQTAIVTGPKGSEIWTDKYGRVKLKFHWDRSDVKDDNSSCWVRVSYPWAGGGYGGVNIPRVGTEVIVDFENGDPDRPMVVGRLYNAETMPPWELPGNATQSGVLTRSTKLGTSDTANAIRFEDKKGEEELWIHAEKDMRTEVEHDESHSVEHDRRKSVDNDEATTIGHDRTETVGNNEHVTINENRTHDIGRNAFLTVGRNYAIKVEKDLIEDVGNHRHDKTAVDHTIETGGNTQHSVQGHHKLQAGQGIEHKTTVFELSGAERVVIKGPGGTITIDGGGVTIEGAAIKLKGAVSQSSGSGNGLSMSGSPASGGLINCAERA